MLSFLVSLGLGFGAIDFEKLPVRQVQTIAEQVMASMQVEMRTQPTLMITERPEPTPLGALNFANGKCVVIINTNQQAWSQWGRFLNRQNTSEWNEIIAASVAHEMGHCLREGRQFANSQNTQAIELKGIQNTGMHAPRLQDMIYRQELFADAVAIMYARENAGEKAEDVIQTLIRAREQHGSAEPTHNTAAVLNQLVKADTTRREQETLGGAAARLLGSI